MTFHLCFPAKAGADSGQDAQMAVQKISASGAGNGQGSADKMAFTGSFVYTYPIEIPPGIAGVQPNLSLAYNSSAGNSWTGTGWDLSIGSIQRSTKNGPPKYTDADVFVFNAGGAAIELISADGGVINYRSKIEGSFQRFVRSGNSWSLYDKTGNRFFFGTSAAGRVGPNAALTYQWALEKMIDRIGNFYTVSYTTDGGQVYPDVILYTGHDSTTAIHRRVKFTTSARPDPSFSYRPGFRLEGNRRLTTIETQVSPSGNSAGPWNTVRRYALQYGARQNGVRSILASIQVTGVEGASTVTLPAHRFDYLATSTAWPAPTSGNSPFQLKELITYGARDNGVRFADLDGDGRTDMVRSYYLNGLSQKAVWRNTPTGWASDSRWQAPEFFTVERSGYWRDNGIRLVDLNGDGLTDILMGLHYEGTPHRNAWINNGQGFVPTPSWAVPDASLCFTVTGPKESWFRDNGVSLVDVNGDGFPDLVQSVVIDAVGSARRVRLNTGSGWATSDSPEWIIPPWTTLVAQDGHTSVPSGTDFVDLNGDGLIDIIQKIQEVTGFAVENHRWLNTGRGWIETSAWDPGEYMMYRDQTKPFDRGIRFADMNGDGLADLVQSLHQINPSLDIKTVRLNTGTDWGPVIPGNHPEAFSHVDLNNRNASNPGTALLDVNGDGRLDFVRAYSQPGWGVPTLSLSLGAANQELVRQITVPSGGTMVAGYGTTSADGGHKIPFPITYISSLTTNDGRGGSISESFSYLGGLFDPLEREFLGFSQVDSVDAAGIRTRSYFHQITNDAAGRMVGNPLKGRSYKEEVMNGSTVLTREETEWEASWIGPARFARVKSVTQTNLEGASAQSVRRRNFYDDGASPPWGNIIRTISDGDVAMAGDERTEETEYAIPTVGLLGSFPKRQRTIGASGQTISETQVLYDALSYGSISSGNATAVRQWLDKPAPGKWIETAAAYNARGQMTRLTDARGNASTTVYDGFGFPVSVTNRGGHTTSRVQDIRTGAVLSVKDANGQTTLSMYDPMGRLTKQAGPLDSVALPGMTISYHDELLGSPGTQFVERQVRQRSGTADVLWSKEFFDGLSRTYRSERQHIGDSVVAETQINSRGLVSAVSIPRKKTAGSTLWVTTSYDALGRATRVTQPDTTSVTTSYNGRVTSVQDALGRTHVSETDAYGRVIRRREPSITNPTEYRYDDGGNLVSLTDSKGRTATFAYDSLGRKIAMNDPTAGSWTYLYDDNGNLLTQTDARGVKMSLSHDALDRLLRRTLTADPNAVTGKPLGTVLASFVYDETVNRPTSKGQLTSVSDPSGITTFYHDQLGRVTKDARTVDGITYQTQQAYDALGRPTSIRYPSDGSVGYAYNDGGLLNEIRDSSNTVLAAYTNHDALDRAQVTTLAGGKMKSSLTFDPTRQVLSRARLESYSTGSAVPVRDVSYEYDAGRNIKRILDALTASRSQTFGYDPLDRLISAEGLYGMESYAYDSAGNLVSKGGRSYSYDLPGHANAVTTITNGSIPASDTSTLVSSGLDSTTGGTGPQPTSGRYGGALAFNGTSDVFMFPQSESVSPQQFCVMLWVKPKARPLSGTYATLLAKSKPVPAGQITDGFRLLMLGDGRPVVEMARGTTRVLYTCPAIVPLNKWSFLSFSYDGAKMRFYIDGLKQGERLFTGSLTANTWPVTLGASVDGERNVAANTAFQGSLDEPRVQGRHWTAEEIAAAYGAFDGGEEYTYDAAGNSISKTAGADMWTYRFDPDGRLDQVKKNGAVVGTFAYDAFGSRVKKTGASGTTVYVGGLFEVRPDGTKIDHVSGNGGAVCDITRQGGATSTIYFHADHLGSINTVTTSTGAVIQQSQFRPFGERFNTTGASSNERWYTSQVEDKETGLDYYNARFYDPSLGRFISPDSIVPSAMDPQSLNRYAYVRNNPIANIDPTGNSWLSNAVGVASPATWLGATREGRQFFYDNRAAFVSAAIGFVSSGFNPVVAAAAFGTEMAMQTGAGEKFTVTVAEEVFQDVLGMSQKSSLRAAGIGIRALAIWTAEMAYSNFGPKTLTTGANDLAHNPKGGSANDSGYFGPSPNSPKLASQYKPQGLFNPQGRQVGSVVDGYVDSISVISKPLRINHSAAAIAGYGGADVPGFLYGSWGLCYTAANRAMFEAGFSATLNSIGVGGWFQTLTSVVYGNYGGGLYRAAYWNHETSQTNTR